jgi:hypothetical protein
MRGETGIFHAQLLNWFSTFPVNAQMYRYFKTNRLRIGLLIVLIGCFPLAATAQAQNEMQLPTQIVPESPQTVPQPSQALPRPLSHNSETIPSNPMAAQPLPPPPPMPDEAPQSPPDEAPPPSESMEETQPVLPDIFHGCWEGEVSTIDAIQQMPGGAPLGTWTPKTYRICYKRYGNGPYELTLNETGVAPNSRIISPNGTMQLLSSEGNTADMLGSLHFDEYFPSAVSFFGFGGSSTFPVDETTKLRCIVAPDGMHVWATVDGLREGVPWFRAYWHATFYQVPA